jgi:hypothetical protein
LYQNKKTGKRGIPSQRTQLGRKLSKQDISDERTQLNDQYRITFPIKEHFR